MLNPTHNFVVFVPHEVKNVSRGGIVIPDQAATKQAKVVAVGPGKALPAGGFRPTCCKAGDSIVLNGPAGCFHELMVNGEKVYVVSDDFICGVLDPADVAEKTADAKETPRLVSVH